MGRNRDGQGLIFEHTLPAALYHLGISLPIGLEWPLYLLCLAGLGWSLRRRSAEDWLLLLFLGASFLLLLFAQRKFVRYVVPLIPPLAVLAARLVDEGVSGRFRPLWTGWAGAGLLAALASTAAHLGVMAAPDARDRAAQYLRAQSRPGDVAALGSDAW